MIKQSLTFGLRRLILSGLLSTLLLRFADTAPTTVTITQRSPIKTLSPNGDVTGVGEAPVGARYTLVSSQGQQVILQDKQGTPYGIAISATE